MAKDERQLVRRAKRGDEKAFRTLMERYRRKVYSIAYGMVHNPEAAYDISQQIEEPGSESSVIQKVVFHRTLPMLSRQLMAQRSNSARRPPRVTAEQRIPPHPPWEHCS